MTTSLAIWNNIDSRSESGLLRTFYITALQWLSFSNDLGLFADVIRQSDNFRLLAIRGWATVADNSTPGE